MKSFIRESIIIIYMEDHEIFNKKGKFIIFKHSQICPLSKSAKEEVNKYLEKENHLNIIEIDVINEAELKMKIAEVYEVRHESPQILLINDQKCVDDFDHQDISLKRLKELK